MPKSRSSCLVAALGAMTLAATALAGCLDAGGSPAGADASVPDEADADPAAPDAAPGTPDAAVPSGPVMVYVGGGDSKIHVFALDRETLALTPKGATPTGAGPSFLAFDAAARWLVTVNESASAVESYAIDATTGALTKKDGAGAQGSGPAHIGLDRSGAYALVANYGDGTAAVLPVSAAGDFGAATATVAPGANAHQIVADAKNTTIYVPCKGADKIAVYGFAAATGKLTARPSTASTAGAGPRHIALAPDGQHAYVINELDSTVTAYAVAADGALTSLGSLTTLPAGFQGANTGAEIEVHPSGKFVYASNRGDDSIAIFTVGADGKLTAAGHVKTGGARPRHFSLVLGGTALLVANQDSGTVFGFRVNGTTGALTGVGKLADVTGAQFVGALALPAP